MPGSEARPSGRMPTNVLIAGGGPAALEAALALHRFAGDRVTTHQWVACSSWRRRLHLPPARACCAIRGPAPRRNTRWSRASPRTRASRASCRGRLPLGPGGSVAHTVEARPADLARLRGVLPDGWPRRAPESCRARRRNPHGLADRPRATTRDRPGRRGRLPARAGLRRPDRPHVATAALRADAARRARILDRRRPGAVRGDAEAAPLALFGPDAAYKVGRSLLAEAGIVVHAGTEAEIPRQGRLRLAPGDEILEVERIVTLPRLEGPSVSGLPCDAEGFLVTDGPPRPGRPRRLQHAAGDVTAYPGRTGWHRPAGRRRRSQHRRPRGRADRTGVVHRCCAGCCCSPSTRRRSCRRDAGDAHDATVAGHALWWPPTKIAGRELARPRGPGRGEPDRPAGLPSVKVGDADTAAIEVLSLHLARRARAPDRPRAAAGGRRDARGRGGRRAVGALHDETLQGLGGRACCCGRSPDRRPRCLRDAVHDAVVRIDGEIDGLRGLIRELRPAALDGLGLPLRDRGGWRGRPSDQHGLTADVGLAGARYRRGWRPRCVASWRKADLRARHAGDEQSRSRSRRAAACFIRRRGRRPRLRSRHPTEASVSRACASELRSCAATSRSHSSAGGTIVTAAIPTP